jgi:prenylcysteine alpha-carboxyl methylesterase
MDFKTSGDIVTSAELRDRNDAFLLTRLTIRLFQVFGFGYQWILMAIRLALFALLLMPAFLRILIFHMRSKSVRRNVRYGPHQRNLLDIYFPASSDAKLSRDIGKQGFPVMVFVSGGAWIIGYKAWGALFGKVLASNGIIVVTPDYRNFPQGSIGDMVEDVDRSMQWVFDNIAQVGGNQNRIFLVGQSAGAHISSLVVLEQIKKEFKVSKTPAGIKSLKWQASCLRGWIGISGPYNFQALASHLHRRGLYQSVLSEIMEKDLEKHSPTKLVRSHPVYSDPRVLKLLPPIYLFHGSEDNCVPDSSSFEFAFALSRRGVDVTPIIYTGKSHTDPILEDPIGGDCQLLADLVMIMCGSRSYLKVPKQIYPKPLLVLARLVNPF